MSLSQSLLMDAAETDYWIVLGPIPADTTNRTLRLQIVCAGSAADVAQFGAAPAMCVSNTQTTANLDTGTPVLVGWGTANLATTAYQLYPYIAGGVSALIDMPLPNTAEDRYMLLYMQFTAPSGNPTLTITATITQP